MTCKELRDIEEVVNLAKEEIEKENENVTAILDYQDLKSLVTLWYYYCEDSTFYSGPPHNYGGKNTKLKKPKNEIIISMNFQKRILKFKVDKEEEEDFYTDIPIDKPIVPIVTLYNKDDSVEIIRCGERGNEMAEVS